MVRVGGMDPDKRQEIVETESFLIDGQNGMGGPCNRQEMVENKCCSKQQLQLNPKS